MTLELPDLNENKRHPIRCELHINECMFICTVCADIAWYILNRNILFFWQLFVSGNSHGRVRYGVTALNTVVGDQSPDLLRPENFLLFPGLWLAMTESPPRGGRAVGSCTSARLNHHEGLHVVWEGI